MNCRKTTTSSKKIILLLMLINLVLLTSCGQNNGTARLEEPTIEEETPTESNYQTPHSYGGWYCPDNILGFPAVNIQELDKVPVVTDRLPTKEETRNGTSLMYFDTTKITTARPLDISLPKPARYYNTYTKKNELVIVIQAVVADKDTVVGFRYLNGGNGSAWLGEVNFLAETEIAEIGPTPFVSITAETKVSKEKIWEVITNPKYAKISGAMLEEKAFFESDWKNASEVHYKTESGEILRSGIITASWNNMYIQVDYNLDGHHYVEKLLILDDKDNNSTRLHLVVGPHREDYATMNIAWNNWLQKVIRMSEGLGILDRIVPN